MLCISFGVPLVVSSPTSPLPPNLFVPLEVGQLGQSTDPMTGVRFFKGLHKSVHTDFCDPLNILPIRYLSETSLKLPNHLDLLNRLGMCGAIPLLLLYFWRYITSKHCNFSS
jgi:hypothetical protein